MQGKYTSCGWKLEQKDRIRPEQNIVVLYGLGNKMKWDNSLLFSVNHFALNMIDVCQTIIKQFDDEF